MTSNEGWLLVVSSLAGARDCWVGIEGLLCSISRTWRRMTIDEGSWFNLGSSTRPRDVGMGFEKALGDFSCPMVGEVLHLITLSWIWPFSGLESPLAFGEDVLRVTAFRHCDVEKVG